jgi:hypothetical protein
MAFWEKGLFVISEIRETYKPYKNTVAHIHTCTQAKEEIWKTPKTPVSPYHRIEMHVTACTLLSLSLESSIETRGYVPLYARALGKMLDTEDAYRCVSPVT